MSISRDLLRYLFPLSSDKAIFKEAEGNPPYFDALPLSTLNQRIRANTCHDTVLKRYQTRIMELTRRGGAFKMGKKHMIGLESYDISNSGKYISKLGYQSEFISMVKPSDWILSKRTEQMTHRRSTAALMIPQHRRQAAGTGLVGFTHTDKNHERQVEALVTYCSPILSEDSATPAIKQPYNFMNNDEFYEIIRNINISDESIVEERGKGPGLIESIRFGLSGSSEYFDHETRPGKGSFGSSSNLLSEVPIGDAESAGEMKDSSDALNKDESVADV
jgi:hypothetical protein